MRLFVGILLGIVIAVTAMWFLGRDANTRHDVRDELGRAGEDLREGAGEAVGRVRDGIESIDTDKIQENVKEGGRRIADASADAVITGKVKTQFATDSNVSALSIKVSTTDGVVTLSGKVSSQAEIDHAVELASRVEGVREVVSAIQIGER